jgi:hypothetical protein
MGHRQSFLLPRPGPPATASFVQVFNFLLN